MIHQGDIRTTPITQVFDWLAKNSTIGLLQVEGPLGSKSLEIEDGSISMIVDGSGKFRLGNLLVARGKITAQQLEQAQQQQRERGMRLGDILCELELTTRDEIEKVLRFQIHEEVCDLFTWEEGRFIFDSDKRLDEGRSGPHTTKIRLRTEDVVRDASERISKWQKIQNVVPSMNMIFQLTDKGHTIYENASPAGQRLLDLVRIGNNVLAMAQTTQIGRFHVSKALADLVRAEAIQPVPDDELVTLAEDLAGSHRNEQAVYCYRYALERLTDSALRRDITEKIDILTKTVRLGKEVSRGSRTRFRTKTINRDDLVRIARAQERRSLLVRLAVYVVAAVALGLVLYLPAAYLRGVSEREQDPRILRLIEEAMLLENNGDLKAAEQRLHEFFVAETDGVPNRKLGGALRVLQEEVRIKEGRQLTFDAGAARISDLIDPLVEKPEDFTGQERADRRAKARDLLTSLRRDHDDVSERIERVDTLQRKLDQLQDKRLQQARWNFDQQRFETARSFLRAMLEDSQLDTEERRLAREWLVKIDEVEKTAKRLIHEAAQAVRAGTLDVARQRLDSAMLTYPTGRIRVQIARRLRDLDDMAVVADVKLRDAEALLKSDLQRGMELLEELLNGYRGTPAAAKAEGRFAKLSTEQAKRMLATAIAAEKAGRYAVAFDLYLPLAGRARFADAPESKEARNHIATLPQKLMQWLADAKRPHAPWGIDQGLEICTKFLSDKNLGKWARAQGLDRLRPQLEQIVTKINSQIQQAVELEQQGRVAEGWELRLALRTRYPKSPAVIKMGLPLRIESEPTGATVRRGDQVLGATPLTVTVGTFASGALELSLNDHQPQAVRFGNPPRRVLNVKLAKGAAFVTHLEGEIAAAAAAVGNIVAVAAGWKVYGLDAVTGRIQWSTPISRSGHKPAGSHALVKTPLFAYRDMICLITEENLVIVLGAQDGAVRHRIKMKVPLVSGPIAHASFYGQVMIYAAEAGGKIRTISLKRGKPVRNKLSASGAVHIPMVKAGQTLVINNENGKTTGIDLQTLRTTWERETGVLTHEPAVRGAYMALLTRQGKILLLEAKTGRVAGSHDVFIAKGRRVGLLSEREILVAESGKLESIHLASGRTLWSTPIDGAPTVGPQVAARLIVVGTSKNTIYALRAASGKLVWKYEVGETLVGRLLIDDATVIITTRKGTVIGVRTH